MSAIDRFDELSAIIRTILYLYRHPKSGISAIIKNSTAGQKAVYSAKQFLDDRHLLLVEPKATLPYTPQYSLTEKGKKIAEHLEEIQKLLEMP